MASEQILSTPSTRISAFSPVSSTYSRFSEWRASLGLPNPGTVENLQQEVNITHATRHMFDGARAEISKVLAVDPLFQLTHGFTLGSAMAPSSYNLSTVFLHKSLLLQGNIDNEGSLMATVRQGWSEGNSSKVMTQLSNSFNGRSAFHLEHDYRGRDYTASFKAQNPSPVDLSGVYIGSYLQSVTKNLAVGCETMYEKQGPEAAGQTSYVAKYTGTEKDWIATAQVHPMGSLQATYWQKLTDKVELAADLQLLIAPQRRDALATVGMKYDLRLAQFRAQVDSTGKVAAVLEQKFGPIFNLSIAGEIDHAENKGKFGVGLTVEASSLSPEEMGMPPQ